MLPGVEGPLPCHVHKVMRPGAAQPNNAGFGERGRKPVAKQSHLIGKRHLVERQNRDGCARPKGQASGTRL